MRRALLGNEVLGRETYHTFRAVIEKLGATFGAAAVTRRGADRITVEGGEVTFDMDEVMMTERELEAFEEKRHWEEILDQCREAGFFPMECE